MRLLSALGVLLLLAAPALAQRTPETIPADLHEGAARIMGDSITFCVDDRTGATAPDIAIATAIGEVLLLDVDFYRISEMPGRADRVTITDDLLFVLLTDECDAFLGMRLGERVTVTDFLTVTTPYIAARYVLAATDPAITDFDALAAHEVQLGIPVLSRMNSTVAYFFPDTWRRIYGTEAELLAAMEEGAISAGLFFGPELLALREGDLTGLALSRVDPVPYGEVPIGMLLYREQTFLRGLIDDAIAALEASGAIADILAAHGFAQLP